mmetsp:Transcript_11763/g.21249  ORF Transcript_11763/g.21249 Transcript_11763/m.21249 type:complete len:221 (+) Transcript_11763:2291-2953(+)
MLHAHPWRLRSDNWRRGQRLHCFGSDGRQRGRLGARQRAQSSGRRFVAKGRQLCGAGVADGSPIASQPSLGENASGRGIVALQARRRPGGELQVQRGGGGAASGQRGGAGGCHGGTYSGDPDRGTDAPADARPGGRQRRGRGVPCGARGDGEGARERPSRHLCGAELPRQLPSRQTALCGSGGLLQAGNGGVGGLRWRGPSRHGDLPEQCRDGAPEYGAS